MKKSIGNIAATTVLMAGITAVMPQSLQGGFSKAWAAHHGMTEKSMNTTADDVKREWAEAVDALKGYSASQRDKAMREAEELLSAMDSRIDKLESRAQDEWNDLSDEARKKRRAALRALRKNRAQVAEWYGGMKHSSGEAWSDVKNGFVSAYDALATSFTEAANEF